MYHTSRTPKNASRVVHARLDAKAQGVLHELRRRTGLADSELVRRGLFVLSTQSPGRGPKIIGLGKYESARPDLGSNKAHLRGFGKR